jgi:hypothetical protein
MRKILKNVIIFILFGLTNNCNSQDLNYSLDTKFGKLKYSKSDVGIVNDLIKICDKEIPAISKELNIKFDSSITIEIYSNQDDYNNAIINPDFKNTPAISGNFKIQMVSPLSSLEAENKVGKISYNDKMYFLIHEYVHLLMDKLESPPPLCIDEGVASLYSSRDFYLAAGKKYVKQINYIPTIEQLINNYHGITAPDMFSCLLIDFMVQTRGKEIIAKLIREPDYIKQFNDSWEEYIKTNYY